MYSRLKRSLKAYTMHMGFISRHRLSIRSEAERGESTLTDAIMDCISYDSYKINIESIDPSKNLAME